jgi:hypothetical protein
MGLNPPSALSDCAFIIRRVYSDVARERRCGGTAFGLIFAQTSLQHDAS